MIKLPDFSISYKDRIDKLIAAHHDEIRSSDLLIVDVRNNGGGSDASYRNLIPYFYTQPIVLHSAEFLASRDNIRYYEQLYESGQLPENVQEQLGRLIEKMKDRPGEFVLFSDHNTDTLRVDTAYTPPHDVAFLINEGSGSSTDQLLLTADQSSKVIFLVVSPRAVRRIFPTQGE